MLSSTTQPSTNTGRTSSKSTEALLLEGIGATEALLKSTEVVIPLDAGETDTIDPLPDINESL